MEMTYLIIGCIVGAALGAIILYFALKSSTVSRSIYDELNFLHIKNKSDLENSTAKIQELNQHLNKEKELNIQQQDLLNDLKNEFAKLSAQHSSLNIQFQEQKQSALKQDFQIEALLTEKQDLFAKNSELSAQNENLQKLLNTQKKKSPKYRKNPNSSLKILPIKS
jgi:DNA recombination protein RmuC